MSARVRQQIGRWALAAPLVLLVGALGAAWMADRQRDWGEPRWDPAVFVPLDTRDRDPVPTHEHWVVPVNPDCPHCSGHLERAAARRRAGVTVQALVVDQRLRPARDVFGSARVDGVWWDSTGIWRNIWGHRLYGETLVFDRDGRLLTTMSPGAEVARVSEGYGVPPDDH